MAIDHSISPSLGAIIIGRNEGDRLLRCLASFAEFSGRVIYVDSGSTDGSVAAAKAARVHVVELDMTRPFTAARARNAGLKALGVLPEKSDTSEVEPLDFIQFIDGDCELQPGWIEAGLTFLQANPEVAVVLGRLRERHPEASVYNKMCDEEWNGPAGESDACGGIALMRRQALADTTLFNPRMIAGEEPDLCLRLRRKGWKIWRLDVDMALHDAAMMRFGQFWKRMRRGGFAYGLWADIYGYVSERPGAASMRRALIWAGVIPFLICLACLVFGPSGVLLAILYPIQIYRNAMGVKYGRYRWHSAVLKVVGKFAELMGLTEFYWRKLSRRPAGLIEHK